MLKERINADLKTSMLSGDKTRVDILKMLKTAITYKEVELGVRDTGLTDEQIIDVLTKEAKKRLDAAQMYEQAGSLEKAKVERSENLVVREYLPEQMSDDDVALIVDSVIAESGDVSMKDMGKIIGAVKAKAGNTADGSRVAAILKQKLV